MPDISSLLAEARPRELVVAICLAGDLAGDLSALREELAALGAEWVPSSMGETDPRLRVAERISVVREQMRERTVHVRVRALGYRAFAGLIAAHPAPEGADSVWDPATFLPALVQQCCVDPVLTVAQVEDLLDVLNDGQAQELFAAALAVNQEASPLPF